MAWNKNLQKIQQYSKFEITRIYDIHIFTGEQIKTRDSVFLKDLLIIPTMIVLGKSYI